MKLSFRIEKAELLISKNFTLSSGYESLESFKKEPNLHFLSPLEKRRLKNAASCAFHLYEAINFTEKPLLVFSSYAGEVSECVKMLEQIISENSVSPNAFSLSVLNATPALLAIKQKNQNEILALSANPALEYAIINAFVTLCQKPEQKAFIMSYYESLDGLTYLMGAFCLSLAKPNYSLEILPSKTRGESISSEAVLSELDFFKAYQSGVKHYEFEALNLHFLWEKL